jgi:hypothetical protein
MTDITHAELNYVDFMPLDDANAFLYGNPYTWKHSGFGGFG